MRSGPVLVFCVATVLWLAGCASMNATGVYRSSAGHNINPAPKSMTPPSVGEGDPTVIDPTYMRTQADYHYALGEALSMDGESEKAIEEFKLTTIYDPKSATVRLRLAGEYLRQGLLTEAVEQAEAALQIEPDNVDVRVFLGGVYSALKMYPQAMAEYDQILRKDPNHYGVHLMYGELLAEQRKFDEAEKHYLKAAVPKYEKAHHAYFLLGRMRVSQGEEGFKRAEKAFMDALRVKPDFEEAVLSLAELQEVRGQEAKALRLLESFQDQYGPRKIVALRLGQHYLERKDYDKALKHLIVLEQFEPNNLNVKMKIALILIERRDYERAIDKLEEILSLAPTSDKVRFYLAAVYEELKDFPQAITHYKRIEATSSFYPEAVVHVSYLYKQSGDMKSALNWIEKALQARDDVPNFYSFYAALLDEMREYTKGVTVLEKAVAKFPENIQLKYYLGSLYDRVSRRDDSINMMKAVIAADPDHVQALNFLAYTYAELNIHLTEAEEMAIKAMELQPNDGYILDTVGWVYFKQGRIEEAIRYLEAAHKLKPDESIVAEHLGDAYYVYELSEKARDMYIKAIAVEKDEKKADFLRSKIVSIENNRKGRVPASVQPNSGR